MDICSVIYTPKCSGRLLRVARQSSRRAEVGDNQSYFLSDDFVFNRENPKRCLEGLRWLGSKLSRALAYQADLSTHASKNNWKMKKTKTKTKNFFLAIAVVFRFNIGCIHIDSFNNQILSTKRLYNNVNSAKAKPRIVKSIFCLTDVIVILGTYC